MCIYYLVSRYFIFFFFFQAEDGIRDGRVTGVQTCALPIFPVWLSPPFLAIWVGMPGSAVDVSVTGDRKSTRLNSSHPSISYAVFCLKKKNRTQHTEGILASVLRTRSRLRPPSQPVSAHRSC